MTSVITVPPSLDDHTFEQVVEQLAAVPADAKLLVDARHTRWASPYGLTALLALGQTRARARDASPCPSRGDRVVLGAHRLLPARRRDLRLARLGARSASGGESSVLLEITPVVKSEDVHEVVGRIQQKAQQILSKELQHRRRRPRCGFAMTLSEVCQNIVEHAGRGGWVAVQTYTWRKRLAEPPRRGDRGVRRGPRLPPVAGERAGPRARATDGTMRRALEEAVIRGVSRFRDPGRGQGLAGVRRYVGRWDGKLSVRSGTARIAIVPSWDDDVPLLEEAGPVSGVAGAGHHTRAGLRGPALMMHIDVSSVLRQTLSCELYSNLVTRPTGAAVRTQIEALLADSRERVADRDRLLARGDDRLLVRRRGRRQAAAALRVGRARRPRGVLPLPRRDGRSLGRHRDGARAARPRAGARDGRRRSRIVGIVNDARAARLGKACTSWAAPRAADLAMRARRRRPTTAARMLRRRCTAAGCSCGSRTTTSPWAAWRTPMPERRAQPAAARGRVHRDARRRCGARPAGAAASRGCARAAAHDGELAWIYGPRRQELATVRVDAEVRRGDVVLRDMAGASPSEMVRVVKPDLDSHTRTRRTSRDAPSRARARAARALHPRPARRRAGARIRHAGRVAALPSANFVRRSARRTGSAIRATATCPTPSSCSGGSRRSRRPRRRAPRQRHGARRRARSSPSSAPATTSSRAAGSTAARRQLLTQEFATLGIDVTLVDPLEPRALAQAPAQGDARDLPRVAGEPDLPRARPAADQLPRPRRTGSRSSWTRRSRAR